MPRTSDRNYEAMVILNAGLGDEETEALVGKLRGILTEGGAEIRETSLWGRRRLAYEIQKKKEGYYLIFYFTLDSPGDTLEQFEKLCRYNEDILRHMVVKVPFKKKGEDVKQIVPKPGHLADYKFEPRVYRRRPPRDARRPVDRQESAPAEQGPVDSPVAGEAKADEVKKEPVVPVVEAAEAVTADTAVTETGGTGDAPESVESGPAKE